MNRAFLVENKKYKKKMIISSIFLENELSKLTKRDIGTVSDIPASWSQTAN